jgi:hypothetical protein
VSKKSEMKRICGLPRRQPWEGRALPPKTAALADRLLPIQRELLADLETAPAPCGVLGDVGAGFGKTLPSFLAPHILGLLGHQSLLIVPADLVNKTHNDHAEWLEIFPELQDTFPEVISASVLSHPKYADVLFDRNPALLILDEAHTFSDPKSARTRRLIRYMQQNPKTRVMALSGTLTHKQLYRLSHLAELVLREHSFLPLEEGALDQWSMVLDYGVTPDNRSMEELDLLVDWARLPRPKRTSIFSRDAHSGTMMATYRAAYRERRSSTPLVVCTPDASVRASLNLRKWECDVPSSVLKALGDLSEKWELPDGTELVDTLEIYRHAATLSWGFYYKINYHGEGVREWLDTRRAWGKAVRTQIEYIQGYANLDSPARVQEAASKGKAHPRVCDAWRAWGAIRDLVQTEQTVVWVDEDKELLHRAIDYVVEKQRAILWYRSKAVEDAIAEHGAIPVFGAGTNAPGPDTPLVACSIFAHGTGKNLQAWSDQLIMEHPNGHRDWEQLLARTHRHGQTSDSVLVDVATHTDAAKRSLFLGLQAARYAEETGPQRQRLCYATWLNPPKRA